MLIYLYRSGKRDPEGIGFGPIPYRISPLGSCVPVIQKLSDRTGTVAAVGAATGSMTAGLHRHISILADSLGSSAGAYLYDPVTRLYSGKDGLDSVRSTVNELEQLWH